MRLFKKTAALVMVVMMLVTAMSSFTLASANAVVDKFEVKEFSVINSTGGSDLTAGNVRVNVTLKRVSGSNNTDDSASVIAAVYSGTEMVDVASSTKGYVFNGTEQTNVLPLTIGEGKTDLSLKVFLWSDDMITPIAKSSDVAKVTGFTIAGEDIDVVEGTTSYNVTLPNGTPAEPEVTVKADGILKATVSYADSVATITTDKATYTIAYTNAQPAAPNVTVMYDNNWDSATNAVVELTDTGILRSPDARLTSADNQSLTAGVALGGSTSDASLLAANASLVYNDRIAEYYETVPAVLEGATYYRIAKDTSERLRTEITVTTDKSIRLYYSGFPHATYTYGTNLTDITTFTVKSASDADYPTAALSSYTSSNLVSGGYTLHYYDLEVPAGQTSVTKTLRCGKNTGVAMFIAYKPIASDDGGDTGAVTVPNAVVKTAFGGSKPFGRDDGWAIDTVVNAKYVYDEVNGNYQVGTSLEDNTAALWKNGSATRLSGDYYTFIQNAPAEVLGADSFVWLSAHYGTGDTDAPNVRTNANITVYRDSTLYCDTTDEFVDISGATQVGNGIKVIIPTNAAGAPLTDAEVGEWTTTEPNAEGVPYHGGRLFKIELEVPDGAESATFQVPLTFYGEGDNLEYPILIIK